MFLRMSSPICSDCTKEEEKIFDTVRQYLNENPGKGINEVSEATEVPLKKILKYIRDGRLEMTGALADQKLFTCDRCGTPISKGTLCDGCMINYQKAVQTMKEESSRAKLNAGMHSLPKNVDGKRK